jgi:hypothetical protein
MSRRIFLIPETGGLREMVEQGFDAESVLQELLSDYPDLLAGDQMNEQEPRRWLLVSREAGVPDRLDGSNRWSLDHLFLDQDGVPTLVEVKRSTDTRIRREVVAQMLDDGLSYHDYLDQLAMLLFLKMAQERADLELIGDVLADLRERAEVLSD